MKKESRTLVFVRHAHRDIGGDRERDNGLSDEGQKQARRIQKRFEKRFVEGEADPTEIRLLSSERKRCQETLAPIAEASGLAVHIDDSLMEGEPLATKIASFLKRFEAADEPVWIACSHGDWIPEAIRKILGAPLELKKGAWAEIRFKDGEARLECLLQEP